jgi:hypothetical protein
MKVEVYLAMIGKAQPSRAGDILLEFPLFNLYTADRVGGPAGPMRYAVEFLALPISRRVEANSMRDWR